jgi:2,3-bisphosphoglycerate-dependent phosphoglycerate mutase
MRFVMRKITFVTGFVKVILISLLLSNFSAFAQKTNIWIVRDAENSTTGAGNNLSTAGLQRAQDLLKALKREKIQTIYINSQKASELTVYPLAEKDKILPRVYTDSIKAFVSKIMKNFKGENVLIVAQYDAIIPIIEELGAKAPFDKVNDDDYDLLFSITIDDNDKTNLFVSHYGKSHHSTEIPQEFILQNFYPNYAPPMSNH